MNGSKVKIRGIYTTALTSILLAEGYTIVSPSQTIRQRFHITVNDGQEDVAIFDRQDHRGVHIEGTDEPVAQGPCQGDPGQARRREVIEVR